MSAAFESFVAGDCSGAGGDCEPCEIPNSDGDAFTRLNPETGRPERLGTGEQFGLWVPFWADDSWPETGDNYPAVADTHSESLDPLCDAAANAVNAIHTLLDGVFALYADEVEPAVASSETAILVGATIGSLFYPPASAIIGAAEFGFAVFYDVMGHLTEDYWNDRFEEVLTCILKNNATLNEDGSVTFAYTVVLWEMLSTLWNAQAYVLLVAQVQYLLNVIGRDGLDAAGALDAVTGDCSSCGEWCAVWTGAEQIQETFTLSEGTVTTDDKLAWVQYGSPFDGAYKRIWLQIADVDTSQCVIESVGVKWYKAAGGSDVYQYMSALPGLDAPTYQYGNYNTGTTFTTTTNSVDNVTTGDETDISIRVTSNNGGDWGVLAVRITGTGTNPFPEAGVC